MNTAEKIRIDKFLWAVRIYKTRSLASDECRKGRVLINNLPAKPSHAVGTGETIMVKKVPVIYTYKVILPVENRVSARLVENYILDCTPEEEKAKLLLSRATGFGVRPRGLGRPTKKERRSIDRLTDSGQDS
ncbi:MAG TPA: S4 domain-containing protein [Bacteroidales bacterium]|nr:S4 domain-containing protein [Bacteroidales bacterium]